MWSILDIVDKIDVHMMIIIYISNIMNVWGGCYSKVISIKCFSLFSFVLESSWFLPRNRGSPGFAKVCFFLALNCKSSGKRRYYGFRPDRAFTHCNGLVFHRLRQRLVCSLLYLSQLSVVRLLRKSEKFFFCLKSEVFRSTFIESTCDINCLWFGKYEEKKGE